MSACFSRSEVPGRVAGSQQSMALDAIDRRIVDATQEGLPICARPYERLAEDLGVPPQLVMERFEKMLALGVVRRIAAVPNHYRLGVRANGMSVWDVFDQRAVELGRRVGALDFVSHCYLRPRRPPRWTYNLFAMVHGRDRDEVSQQVEQIAGLLGDASRAHDVLFSTRILKKTGLRLARKSHQANVDD